jgi:hypothetical protein
MLIFFSAASTFSTVHSILKPLYTKNTAKIVERIELKVKPRSRVFVNEEKKKVQCH